MAEEVKNKQLNSEYQAIDSRYRRAVAVTQARPKLIIIFFVIWAVLDLVLIIKFGLGVLNYFVDNSYTDERLMAEIFNNVESLHTGVSRGMPTPLLIDTVKTASVQSGHQDIFAEVTNYNQDWYATFDYSFSYSGGQSESYSGFINPNTTQTLSAVNLEIANRPSGLSLSLANLTWHHIDQRLIPDIAAFLDERDNITVEVPTYATDISLGKENLARASFTLTNRTAYSYWEPVFLVKLSRGSSIIALTTVSVPEFKAGESRPVEVRWFGSLPATASVAVEPLIPYFDDRIYMRPSSE